MAGLGEGVACTRAAGDDEADAEAELPTATMPVMPERRRTSSWIFGAAVLLAAAGAALVAAALWL